MITLLSIVSFGFFLGMRHATDADHVVAVTTFVSRERSVRGASIIGMIWGLGHTLTVTLVGTAITFFGLVVPERLGLSLEFGVALMLITLGLWNAESIFRWVRGTVAVAEGDRRPPAADTSLGPWLDRRFGYLDPRQILRPFIVGVVHGLAGSAALALLALPVVQDPSWAVAYMLVYGFGTIAGMMLITAAIAWPCARLASHSTVLGQRLAATAGLLSLGLGLFLAYQIGFVEGLFVR